MEALIVQVADNGIRIIGARMAEIDTLVSGNDGDEAAGVASVERLGVEVLVHPIVFIVVHKSNFSMNIRKLVTFRK